VGEPLGRDAAWENHEREQGRAWLRLTPRERLDWLWQAKLFVERVEKARAREPGSTGEPGERP
jgi:hypothetical protein